MRTGATMVMVIAIGLTLAGARAHAEPIGEGARIPEIALDDQHDVRGTVAPETRFLLLTRDMDASGITKTVLAEHGDTMLANAGAVYVADISAMPSLVTKLFAMPGLRKRPYRMLLDRDGKATKDLPYRSGAVTVLTLDHAKIQHVEYVTSPDRLRAILTAAAG